MPRWDVWFELHDIDMVCETWDADPNEVQRARRSYQAWLRSQSKPIVVRRDQLDRVPSGVPYPKEDIIERFPRAYFTNTISWMTALAIAHQPAEIGIWGVDMATNEEYGAQRPSCEYFIGVADGLGIPLHIPPTSDLCKSRKLYGFDQNAVEYETKIEQRLQQVRKEKERIESELRKGERMAAHLTGLDEALTYMLNTWQ